MLNKLNDSVYIFDCQDEKGAFKNIELFENKNIGIIITVNSYDYSLIWKYKGSENIRHYMLNLSDYPVISPWELKQLTILVDYEKEHQRKVVFWFAEKGIEQKVAYALNNTHIYRDIEVPEKLTQCTACYQKGCIPKFLCHTSSIEDGISIINCGKIKSAVKAREIPAETLKKESRNTAGDPPDYFDYVMFSYGNCQTGDRIVMERELGRDPTENDLSVNFKPGVRFYFKYKDLLAHSNASFDGYHPIKIRNELNINDYIFACVIPLDKKEKFEKIIPDSIKNRIFYIKNDCQDIYEWSNKVYEFIESLE